MKFYKSNSDPLEDWKVERLYVEGALIAIGQPTAEHIKSEPNTAATKQFSCIIPLKSSFSIQKNLL